MQKEMLSVEGPTDLQIRTVVTLSENSHREMNFVPDTQDLQAKGNPHPPQFLLSAV